LNQLSFFFFFEEIEPIKLIMVSLVWSLDWFLIHQIL